MQAVDRGESYDWAGPSTWACYRQDSNPRSETHNVLACPRYIHTEPCHGALHFRLPVASDMNTRLQRPGL